MVCVCGGEGGGELWVLHIQQMLNINRSKQIKRERMGGGGPAGRSGEGGDVTQRDPNEQANKSATQTDPAK